MLTERSEGSSFEDELTSLIQRRVRSMNMILQEGLRKIAKTAGRKRWKVENGRLHPEGQLPEIGIFDDKPISLYDERHYQVMRTLGTGSFSTVKLGFNRRECRYDALKFIPKEMVNSCQRSKVMISREFDILQTLPVHPHIVKYNGQFETINSFVIAMEWCSGGEMFNYVKSKGRLSEEETGRLMKQVLLAVEFMHARNLAHRDLKLENLLFSDKSFKTVKLVDFGLSRYYNPLSPVSTTRCGSEEYAAPEVLCSKCFSPDTSDIWSFGVVMYACLYGTLPFASAERNIPNNSPNPLSLYSRIFAANYRFRDDIAVVSDDAKAIIEATLQVNPKKRPTATQLLRNPWFNR